MNVGYALNKLLKLKENILNCTQKYFCKSDAIPRKESNDSGNSGYHSNTCHNPSVICKSTSTPAWRSFVANVTLSLRSKSRVLEERIVGLNKIKNFFYHTSRENFYPSIPPILEEGCVLQEPSLLTHTHTQIVRFHCLFTPIVNNSWHPPEIMGGGGPFHVY